VKLAPATPQQAPAMASAHALAFDAPWSEADFAELMENPGVFGFVALGEDPLGVVLCGVAAGQAEILTIAVPPWARRKGIARSLLAAAIAAAGQAGAQEMFLEVDVANAAAIALYESFGFERAGLRKAYYDRGASMRADALVMRLDLAGAAL